jgi:hypothetical protein
MGATPVSARQACADARLGVLSAGACLLAYAAFVALPLRVDGPALPRFVEGPWAVGVALSMYVAPVAAGLVGWASLLAFVRHGAALPDAARRTHVATLCLVAVLLVLAVSTLGAAQLWLD